MPTCILSSKQMHVFFFWLYSKSLCRGYALSSGPGKPCSPAGWEVAHHRLPIHTSSSSHSLCSQPRTGFRDVVETHTHTFIHTYQVTWPRHPAFPGSDWSTSWQILDEPARKERKFWYIRELQMAARGDFSVQKVHTHTSIYLEH